MKINENEALNIPKPQTDPLYPASKPDAGSAYQARRSEPGNDLIELGSQSGLVAQAQSAGSDERAARIQQLRALVQSGQYQVDTGALSNSIIGATLRGY